MKMPLNMNMDQMWVWSVKNAPQVRDMIVQVWTNKSDANTLTSPYLDEVKRAVVDERAELARLSALLVE